jgi:hypothetical protein
MDGVVEVLGLEHRQLEDAVEVDDVSRGGECGVFLLRTHAAWRARLVAVSSLGVRAELFIACFQLGKVSKRRNEDIFGARFCSFPSALRSVCAFPAKQTPNFQADLEIPWKLPATSAIYIHHIKPQHVRK